MVSVSYTKEELARVPEAHRSFYLVIGQAMNEIMMLQSLLLRSLQGLQGPEPVKDTGVGLTLFLIRNICGRIYELNETMNSKENGRLSKELWDKVTQEVPADVRSAAEDAKKQLNRSLGPSSALIKLVRNKLAYHLNQRVLELAFQKLPQDMTLRDHHTGRYATTFFGVADTVTAVAVAHLLGTDDIRAATDTMAKEALKLTQLLQKSSEGYVVAFHAVYLDLGRINAGERIRLINLPEAGKARLGFYMSDPRKRTIGDSRSGLTSDDDV